MQAGAWSRTAFSLAWIGSALGGLMAARSSRSGDPDKSTWRDKVSSLAPYVFLAGLVCALSLAAHSLVTSFHGDKLNLRQWEITNSVPRQPQEPNESREVAEQRLAADANNVLVAQYLYHIRGPRFGWLVVAIVASTGVMLIVSCCVDVNEFSLNAMYANRLVRCYLGASRRKRRSDRAGAPPNSTGRMRAPNDLTGFDVADDLSLRDLNIGDVTDTGSGTRQRYWGPFPLINTALNLVSGSELAWQERKAESFVLTPLRYGSTSLGHSKNDFDFNESRNGSLGRLIAVSGAAANPNMGYHSSPAVTALLTLFNVRLGWWLPNPLLSANMSSQERPKFLLKWLLVELFGFTNAKRKFVNLSDGGHFENLGVYELVRRRCRLIIVSDAGADPDKSFEDLGNLIRKCRSDFGIDIEINVDRLKSREGGRFSEAHCAIGSIRYDNVDQSAPVGILLYLKPTLMGDEPADVAHYSVQNAAFPHEPTLDQFFSESQFESYRALGCHTVEAALGEIAARLEDTLRTNSVTYGGTPEDCHEDAVANLVYLIRKQWIKPPTPSHQDVFAANEPFVKLHRDLRNEPGLAHLTRGLYPEAHVEDAADSQRQSQSRSPIAQVLGLSAAQHPRGDLHVAAQMIQVMENAWVGMQLDEEHAHPLNAGWMNLFRRWGNTSALQRYWPMLRHEFSRGFVDFCQRQTALRTEVSQLIPIQDLDNDDPDLPGQLKKEFLTEWSPESETEDLAKHILRSIDLSWHLTQPKIAPAEQHKPVCSFWFARVKVRDYRSDQSDPLNQGFVAGVIGLRTLPDGDATLNVPAHEIFVWVRPGYREHGVGQKMLQSLFANDLFENRRKQNHIFLVRYPKSAWIGAGNRLKKARWLSYFDYYQFRRPSAELQVQLESLALPQMDEIPDQFAYVWRGFEVLVSGGSH